MSSNLQWPVYFTLTCKCWKAALGAHRHQQSLVNAEKAGGKESKIQEERKHGRELRVEEIMEGEDRKEGGREGERGRRRKREGGKEVGSRVGQ